jgi:hypothetical protein
MVSSTLPTELTLDQDNLIPDPYKIGLTGPGGLIAPRGNTTVYTFTLANIGDNADIYILTATSNLSWSNLNSIPMTLSLASGITRELTVSVTIPLVANPSAIDTLQITATSTGNPLLRTSVYAQASITRSTYLPLILRNH